MRKLIGTMVLGGLVAGLGLGIPGCADETKTETQATTSTPGGKRVETETKTIKETGQNPPPPPAGKAP